MEIAVGVVLVLVAWLMWNGIRPPGATVKSSLERDKQQRERAEGGRALKLVLLGLPALYVTMSDLEALAAPLL